MTNKSLLSQPSNNNSKYNISFVKKGDKEDTIRRSTDKESLWSVEVEISNVADDFKNHIIEVKPSTESTLPIGNYELSIPWNGKALKDLSNTETARIIIKKEGEAFRQVKPLKLYLDLKVKKKDGNKDVNDDDSNNAGAIKKIVLVLLPQEDPLYTYKYLGYLGTNFDLVDGVQAKNLFFATNIFIPETKKWGFSLSIYGNRSLTKTDSSKQTTFESKIERINRDSIARHFDSALKVTTRVSDNIGANFIPLIPIPVLSDGTLKFYYAPQFEFIWRRTTIENLYQNNKTIRIDSMRNRFPANTGFPLVTPLSYKTEFNVYDVYLGVLGALLRYENEDISIRVNASVGVNFNYLPSAIAKANGSSGNVTPANDVFEKRRRNFFFGRLWITEPTTGLTLGAEMSNYFGKKKVGNVEISNAQPNYIVTLSKAFNLKNLAAFVKPLTSR